ncbi:hypothetical protein ACE6H2_010652 [Prunus campanulata]
MSFNSFLTSQLLNPRSPTQPLLPSPTNPAAEVAKWRRCSSKLIMERYFKRKFASTTSSSNNVGNSSLRDVGISRDAGISKDVDSSKESELQDIFANLIADLGFRPQMLDYDLNIRDKVQRAYLQKGPCQPKDHTFPQTDLSGYDRLFNVKWFDEFD